MTAAPGHTTAASATDTAGPAARGEEAAWRRSTRRALALPVLLACVVGAFSLDGGFVFDDRYAVLQSPVVRGQVSLGEAAGRNFWGLPLASRDKVSWRPLLPLVWRGLWQIGAGSPLPFRSLSALLHILASGLATLLFVRLLPTRRLAVVAACVFAVHPAHAEAIGGIVAQADVLATVCGLGALLVLLAKAPQRGHLTAALGLIALGSLAKESALLWWPIAALALYAKNADRRLLRGWLLGALPIVLAIALAQVAAHGGRSESRLDNVLVALPTGARLITALAILGRELIVCFVPWRIAPSHGYAVFDADLLGVLPLAGAAVLATTAAHWYGLRALATRNPGRALWIALLFAPALLGCNLIFIGPTEYAERLLYPATLAASALIVLGLHVGLRTALRGPLRRDLAAGAIIAAFLAASWQHQRPWRSDLTLFSHAVAVEPKSWRNQQNLGRALALAAGLDGALWHLMLAEHLQMRLPAPIDWRVVEALEGLEPTDRMLTAPAALAGDQACALIDRLVRVAYAESTDRGAEAQARAVFAQRYRCEAPAS